jgi:hypothetical protein
MEKMGEEPGPRAEGCAGQASCPLKLSWFLSQILIKKSLPLEYSIFFSEV